MPRIASEKPSFGSIVPKCATPEETSAWLEAAGSTYLRSPACGFCSDCTREFKLKMLAQGRCENPGVEFRHNRKEGTYGVLA